MTDSETKSMTQTEAVQLLNKSYHSKWSFTTQGAEQEVLPRGAIYYKVKADLQIGRESPITITGMGFGVVTASDAATPEKHIAAHNAALEGALVNAVQRLGLASNKS